MLKLNIGLSRKVGKANYGSRGASVNLEVEVDSGLVLEPPKLQEKIRQLFGLARSSLAEELDGHNGHNGSSENGHLPARSQAQNNGNGQGNDNGNGNGNANGNGRSNGNSNGRTNSQRNNGTRSATQSQVRALHAIARSQGIDLAAFLRDRFQVGRPDALSIKEASQVIDELKSSEPQERS